MALAWHAVWKNDGARSIVRWHDSIEAVRSFFNLRNGKHRVSRITAFVMSRRINNFHSPSHRQHSAALSPQRIAYAIGKMRSPFANAIASAVAGANPASDRHDANPARNNEQDKNPSQRPITA
jgi:hypothetical protein